MNPSLRETIPRRSFLAITTMLGLIPAACSAPAPSQDAGKEIASKFLQEIRESRIDDAWGSTTSEFKSLLGLEGLRAYVKTHPALGKPAEFVSLASVERNGLSMAECTFRPEMAGSSIKVLLAREASAWKVERVAVE